MSGHQPVKEKSSAIARAGTLWGFNPSDPTECVAMAIDGNGRLAVQNTELQKSLDQFSELRTTERTPIIELSSKYGFSRLRDLDKSANGGVISNTDGEFNLSTSTDPNSTCELESAEVGRYMPGYAAELGVGVRLSGSSFTGNQEAIWGGHSGDEGEGIVFGYDVNGLFVATIREGSYDRKIYRGNWNIDNIDGNGISGYNLTPLDGHIYQISYTWYGYGQIVWYIVATVDGKQSVIPVHQESDFDKTSIRDPNLRISAQVKNNGETTGADIFIAGRQFSIIGRFLAKYRYSSAYNYEVDTSGAGLIPIVSFQRDPNKTQKATSIQLETIQASCLTDDHVMEVYYEPSLTGANFQVPDKFDPNETIALADTTATAIDTTNSVLIYQDLIFEGDRKAKNFDKNNFTFDLPADGIVTVAARPLGTGGSFTALVRIREEW